MKRWLSMALAVLMLLVMPVGCSERLPENLNGSMSYTSRVSGMDYMKTVCWDNYVVTEHSGGIYDRISGEIRYGLCEDPECDGTCFLHKGSMSLIAVRDGRAYMSVEYKMDVYYGYRNMLTGAFQVLMQITREERTTNQPAFLDGAYLYYSRKLLRDGGNPENADDYYAHLCRMPKDGGKEEVLYAMRENTETLLVVAEGYMYSYWQSVIWKTDIATMEQRALCDMVESGLPGMGDISYLDGSLYFYTNDGGMYIGIMNAESGEWRHLIETPVHSYELTNDAVYFTLVDYKQINDPARYPPDSDEAMFQSYSPVLYACDTDGSNVREVWAMEGEGAFEFALDFTVADDIVYGWFRSFNAEENQWGEYDFGEIHLDTGAVISATEVN